MLDHNLANLEVQLHLEVILSLGLMLISLYDKLEHLINLCLCQVQMASKLAKVDLSNLVLIQLL